MEADLNYNQHWDDKFSSRDWGKYPPEDLVRFIGRNFKNKNREEVAILEVGCGPGANVWFLHREGYRVAGIDGSPSAIEKAFARLSKENSNLNNNPADLKVGNFSSLPWENDSFDVVIDIFSIYANTSVVIKQTLSEVYRVLKPGGRFYSKVWGTKTTGYGQGEQLEPNTFDNIPAGPCFNMGLSHFFDKEELQNYYANFQIDIIDTVLRSDRNIKSEIEEIVCESTKPAKL